MISHNYLSSRGVVFFGCGVGGANFDREGPPGGFLLSNSVDIYILGPVVVSNMFHFHPGSLGK